MGGQQSQPVKESQTTPSNGRRRDEIEQGREECQPCFFLSSLVPYTRKKNPVLGSPIPDTPMMERRRRQEVVKQASALQQQQQQQTRDLLPPFPHASSRYGGLEKEESSSFFSNGSFIPPPGGMLPPSDSPEPAQIYEGPDCEEKLQAKYELCEVLGVGSTSTVHRCVNRETGLEYACKIIDLQYMDDKFHTMMIQFHTEIESLKSLHHPGIIQLYDVYILSSQKIYIIMEFMDGGELFDYVVEKGTLTEEEASKIVRVVLSAVSYLHDKNIIHRDLKPENLLLKTKPKNPSGSGSNNRNGGGGSNLPIDVKIIDFGLSKLMEPNDTLAHTFLGTRGYLAPEMLQRREYTRAVDAWAMGVIVFVLLCGCLPFDDDSAAVPHDDLLLQSKFVLRFPRWAKNLSASAKDLLNHLLDINPRTRYSAEQALNHPWVRGDTAPRANLLASPGRIRKSPAPGNASYAQPGRKYAPPPIRTPPTPQAPRVRKGSF